MRRQSIATLLCVVLIAPGICARSSEINEKFKDEDSRLLQRVTLRPKRMLLGDLLVEMRKQTGVLIEEDAHDYAAGTELLVSCKEMPLCDLLDAVWALLSNVDSTYKWYRELRSNRYIYSFYEPDAVKARAARLNDYSVKALDKFVNMLCDLAQLTPEQRSRRKAEFVKAGLDTDQRQIDVMFNYERYWTGYALFAEIVPKENRTNVMLGRQAVDVPLTQTSDKIQELFAAVFKGHHVKVPQPDGSSIASPMPTSIRIQAVPPRGAEVVPTIMIQVSPFQRYSLISTLRLGFGLKEIVKQRWFIPPDSSSDTLEMLALGELPQPKQDTSKLASARPADQSKLEIEIGPGVDRDSFLANWAKIRAGTNNPAPLTFAADVKRLSQRTDTPVLAILPAGSPARDISARSQVNRDFRSDKTIADCLNRLESPGGVLMHKWHNGVLMISYPKWFFDNNTSVPYHIVKEFPGIVGGEIDIKSLVRMVGKVSTSEFDVLSAHYPCLRIAPAMRPILLLASNHPQMLSNEGLSLDQETIDYLQSLPVYGARLEIKEGKVERIRLIEFTKDLHGSITNLEVFVGGRWNFLDALVLRHIVQPNDD